MQRCCSICSTTLKPQQSKYCSKSCSCKGTKSWESRISTVKYFCRVCLVEHTRKKSPWCSEKCKEKEYMTNTLALFENGRTRRDVIKRHCLKTGLFKKECSICKITEWLGRDAPLQLDHINGVRDDNALTNLRLLCANCHAQTDTFCGKNKK